MRKDVVVRIDTKKYGGSDGGHQRASALLDMHAIVVKRSTLR